jgi:hypothetical protein
MAEQSAAERATLNAAWNAHPQVVAFRAAMSDFVETRELTGPEGATELLAFANTWLTENGPLPDSGILCA